MTAANEQWYEASDDRRRSRARFRVFFLTTGNFAGTPIEGSLGLDSIDVNDRLTRDPQSPVYFRITKNA